MNHFATLIAFDISSNDFDAILIAAKLKDILGGDVWNFVPGVFVVKSEKIWTEAADELNSTANFPNFLAIQFDPARVNGKLPPAAWDSWFLDIFNEEIDRTAELNNWTPEYLSKVKGYQKRKSNS